MNTITKINGKLTMSEVVRRIAKRAISGETTDTYNVKYVARRLSKTVPETVHIVKYLAGAQVRVAGANFVFSF